MEVKLSTENIRCIALFEKVTKVHAKDCIITEQAMYFLVGAENVGMAIGRSGSKIKELRRIAGKHVKIFAFSPDLEEFVRNMIPQARAIEIKDKAVSVSVPHEDKVMVIGRNGDNINVIRNILKRHFGVESFKLR